jgi:hypothetical protein
MIHLSEAQSEKTKADSEQFASKPAHLRLYKSYLIPVSQLVGVAINLNILKI